MTFESALGYMLSFTLGAVVALFWAYSGHGARLTALEGGRVGKLDLSTMQAEISRLNATVLTIDIADLIADVKVMKSSIIFDRDFQLKLAMVCTEHKEMHDQIGINTGELKTIKAVMDVKTR